MAILWSCFWGEYWLQRADERHGNPPLDNQELLAVTGKVGRPGVSFG